MGMNNKTQLIQCSNYSLASTDLASLTVVDTQGFSGCRFIFSFSTITSGAATSIGVCGLATSSPTMTTDDLTGSSITVLDTNDDGVFMIDIKSPTQRYLRPWVKRATQNAAVGAVIAELYDPIVQPTSLSATGRGQETWVSPANGTA